MVKFSLLGSSVFLSIAVTSAVGVVNVKPSDWMTVAPFTLTSTCKSASDLFLREPPLAS